MSDIVDTLRFMSYPEAGMAADEIERLRFELEQCRTEAVAMLDKAVMEQSRLRSLLEEADEALECSVAGWELYRAQVLCSHEASNAERIARTVLSKIKGES